MPHLFDDMNFCAHQGFSITNQTSSQLEIMLGQYGDEQDIFNLLTGTFVNGAVECPLSGPLNITVPPSSECGVGAGPSISSADNQDNFGEMLVTWFAGGKNLQARKVNFGVSINGVALNPPPLCFTADDGTWTTVYGGIGQTDKAWTSQPINGVIYNIMMRGGGDSKISLGDTGLGGNYYCFDILIRQRNA